MTKSWAVQVGGVRYEGKPLSGEAVRRFVERSEGASPAVQEAALTALLRLAFPLNWAWLWLGDPVRRILRDPDRNGLLADFYASLRPVPHRPGSPTSGTS